MAIVGNSRPDPYRLDNTIPDMFPPGIWGKTTGLSPRSPTINPAQRTLVLITAGQSQMMNITPTVYPMTYGSKVDQLNIYDGQLYEINGPVLGTSYPSTTLYPSLGFGSVAAQLADFMIFYNKFDRVILCSIAVGGTSIDLWATGGLSDRLPVTMKRLAALGIVPGMTGVTFAIALALGEADVGLGTTKANFESRTRQFLANGQAYGFNGRMFVALETSPSDTLSTVYQGQVGVVDNITIFQGANLNTITGGTYRNTDGTHLTDAGRTEFANRWITAMAASGAPF